MAGIKNKKIYFSALVTLLLLIFFHYLGWLNWFESKTRDIFIPLFSQTHSIGVNLMKKKEPVLSEFDYQKFLTTASDNQVMSSRLKILEEENEELKKLLQFNRSQTYSYITVKVIGKGLENVERSYMIAVGLNDGIKVGQPVIAGGGIMIGKISKVSNNSAWVRLINDNNSKVAAVVLSPDKSQGIVEGGYGLSVRMNFIPRNEKVQIGNQVTTSGLEEWVPRGLLLGTISVVENEAYQPFQKAVLTPAVDLSKIIIVSVLRTENI